MKQEEIEKKKEWLITKLKKINLPPSGYFSVSECLCGHLSLWGSEINESRSSTCVVCRVQSIHTFTPFHLT